MPPSPSINLELVDSPSLLLEICKRCDHLVIAVRHDDPGRYHVFYRTMGDVDVCMGLVQRLAREIGDTNAEDEETDPNDDHAWGG